MTYHCMFAAAMLAVVRAQDRPLLSTIATVPELSSFSAVVLASGGSQPNPAFEERFNSVLDGRNYTALAPTNDAINKISPAVVEALTAAPAYPIFESIIRTHVAEGLVTSADVVSASPFEAIEGFPLTAAVGGEQAILVNNQAQIVAVDTFASNGVVHQIDQVLNPFTGYFGISNATAAPTTSDTGGTVGDILLSDQRLSTIRDILQALSPDLINVRLRLAEAGGTPQIFAVPSNDAFVGLPDNTVDSSIAPSNQPLSLQLYSFGLLGTDARFADLDFSSGPINVPSSVTGINVTATQADGGATFLNNAAIQEQVCGSNGCVWIVDRVLDPLYLAFGPLNRDVVLIGH
ncbi:hypothetical protein KVR01_002041 [Diaporthe batatas]|uniref:uncharacterized protein n=1 Tax=Diaporthe batatas TaxID=748121 RepID=UPI001D0390DD|nr:uncharacterized protein KVR01_002041 [Diaporthe batatas]KAG8166352.1 hypothetical protein KVR01_002041 [Diaporthe batatas]